MDFIVKHYFLMISLMLFVYGTRVWIKEQPARKRNRSIGIMYVATMIFFTFLTRQQTSNNYLENHVGRLEERVEQLQIKLDATD